MLYIITKQEVITTQFLIYVFLIHIILSVRIF